MQAKHGLWICAIVQVNNDALDSIYMKRLLVITATIALLGLGCTKQQPVAPDASIEPNELQAEQPKPLTQVEQTDAKNLNQPLQYDLGNVLATAERSLLLLRNTFTAEMLISMSEECGSTLSANHFDSLLKTFKYQRGHRYDFLYRNDSQEPSTYTLSIFANEPGYENLEEFKNDFDVCAAGSILYPLDLNKNWLMFESGCETGFDDGTNRPIGCTEIRDQLRKTLKLN